MKGLKYIQIIGMFALVSVFFLGKSHASLAEDIRPIRMEIQESEKDSKEFVVTIQTVDTIALSAFDFSIKYDNTVLEIDNKEGAGYYFTEEFNNSYENGVALCNHKNDPEIIFSGAKVGAEGFHGQIARIYFKIKDVLPDSVKPVTTITLNIGAIGVETSQGVQQLEITNPVTSQDILVKNIPGDVTLDGQVTLEDALLTLRAALNITMLSDIQVQLADIDEPEGIDLADALKVLKLALNIIR